MLCYVMQPNVSCASRNHLNRLSLSEEFPMPRSHFPFAFHTHLPQNLHLARIQMAFHANTLAVIVLSLLNLFFKALLFFTSWFYLALRVKSDLKASQNVCGVSAVPSSDTVWYIKIDSFSADIFPYSRQQVKVATIRLSDQKLSLSSMWTFLCRHWNEKSEKNEDEKKKGSEWLLDRGKV